MNTSYLRGEIFKRYKNQVSFAKALNWGSNKVSRLLLGRYLPNVDEVYLIIKALNLSDEQIKDIFF